VFAQLIQDPTKVVRHIENPAPPPEIDAYGQLPKLASTFRDVDGLFYFTYVVCIFFFVLILGVLLFSCVKYRRRTWDQPAASNTTHNTPLEVVWTVIPLIIVMVMFAWGFKGCLDMTTVPLEASRNTYKATAKQWSWSFTYPDGTQSFNDVWVEVNKPVQFLLESTDVLHAFYIPSMRVKRDVVPGRFQSVWFEPTETGVYHLFCAEYCGTDHSRMYARVHVVKADEYAKQPWNVWLDSTPAEAAQSGAGLYKQLCASCHSVDGSVSTGPTWKGLFTKQGDAYVGRQRDVIEGGAPKTITVDEAYIHESIMKPDQKKVAELPYRNNAMTAFPNLDERRRNGLIQYMKSLADQK
jgi:cytochrome c oxidase subunit II